MHGSGRTSWLVDERGETLGAASNWAYMPASGILESAVQCVPQKPVVQQVVHNREKWTDNSMLSSRYSDTASGLRPASRAERGGRMELRQRA